MIKIPVNTTRLLIDNLKARQRLGLAALSEAEQRKLKSWLNPAVLAVRCSQPLNQQEKQLWLNMLKVLGLKEEDVAFNGQGRHKLVFCLEEQPENENALWCWHPQALLQKPGLKKQAYQTLKKIKAGL